MPDALSLPPLPVNAQFLGPEGRPPDVLSAVMLPQPLERHGVPGSQEDARQYKKAKDRDNLHDSESINGGNTASIIADVAMDLSRTESGLLNVQSQTETPTTGVVEELYGPWMTVDTRRHRNAIPPTHNRNATSRNQCGGVDTRSRFSALVVDEDVDKGVLGLPTDGSAPREAVVVGSAKNTSSLNMIALPQVQVEPNAAYMKSNPAKKLRVVARTIERLEQVVVQVDQDVVVISQNKAGKFDQHTAVTLLEMTSTSAQPSANRDMSCPFIGVGHDPPKGGSTTTHIGDQSPSVQDDPSNGQKTMEM
ncbi:hypothetical protein V6N13_088142 [Hibiscus sabdariffa]